MSAVRPFSICPCGVRGEDLSRRQLSCPKSIAVDQAAVEMIGLKRQREEEARQANLEQMFRESGEWDGANFTG